MNTLTIKISQQDLYSLIKREGFVHIRIYRSDTETGVYTELTNSSTRILLVLGKLNYFYYDNVIAESKWYKISYGNDLLESTQSAAFITQLGNPDKIGFYFGNYFSPEGLFGEVLTADDLRYHYLWGIDAIAQNANKDPWTDDQYRSEISTSVGDFEKFLNIDIIRRKYLTRPVLGKVKADVWMDGVDYTDEEAPYDFDANLWQNYGFLQLRHKPVIEVTRADLVGPTEAAILALLSWTRLDKELGQLNFFPRNQMIFGPFEAGYGSVLLWRLKRYPQGLQIDYESGFENANRVPSELRDIIGKWAAIKSLNIIGDGILPGFSSQSISLDGLSESFSSTQSATNAYFGARILVYTKEVVEWLKVNKYKYGSIPIGFIGS